MAIAKPKTVKEAIAKALPSAAPSSTPRRAWLRFVGFVLGGIVTAAVLTTGVVVVGSYTARWHSPFVEMVADIVPYPAMTVNGNWESYATFLDTVTALDRSYSQPGALEASGLTSKPTRAELEELVLDRMAKDEMVRQFASARGVTVTETALDAAMNDVISQAGSESDVRTRIQELYGWDLEMFAARVVEPFLYRQRLQEKIAYDDGLNAEQQQRITALLTRVKDQKEDFATVAGEVNEDATKDLKGDYGSFARGERDQAVEDAVFAMNPGDISDVVRTAQGFHILKLLEKLPADEATGDPERVHALHIFVAAKQLDGWLFEQAASQKVRLLVTGYRWDGSAARIVPTAAAANSNSNSSQ